MTDRSSTLVEVNVQWTFKGRNREAEGKGKEILSNKKGLAFLNASPLGVLLKEFPFFALLGRSMGTQKNDVNLIL